MLTYRKANKANAFASTFYFFADTQANAKKIKRACKPTHPDSATVQCIIGRTTLRTDRRASANKGLKEMAGEVVNQTVVLLINSCGRLTVRASKPPLL
jgi:hypothetical protein